MSRNWLLSFVVAALAVASGTAASDQAFERVSESSPGSQEVDSAAGATGLDGLGEPLPQADETSPGAPTLGEAGTEALEPGSGPADRILASIAQTPLRLLARDVLERNPQIAAAAAQARAAERRAPQVAALPDPVLAFTAFILTPETRVGPQEFAARFSQKFPWFGKLKLKEQAALYVAAAAKAEVEATRLRILTETRRLYYELGFLDTFEQVVRADRATLSHYEELARARYSSGVGLQQAVIKIQAEITKADSRILDIGDRRATLVAVLNSLRDSPQDTSIPRVELSQLPQVLLDLKELRSGALELRPEIAAADARIAQAQSFLDLAHKDYRPDVTVGLGYTLVGSREDEAGRLMPPLDNGEDIFGVTAGLNLPIWRKKLAAGVEEALELEVAAKESKRNIVTQIDRALGELPQRIDFTWQQLRLFEDVLIVQAEQSLLSAEAGYSAGTQDALDLLDAERVLFDVRTGTERNLVDYAIAIAQLEGAIAAPFPFAVSRGVND